MTAAVGADIEALCAKCGDVWHVVVAKDDGGRIAKVQCKQCGGYHRYKSPHGAPLEKRQPSPFAPKPVRSISSSTKAPVERFEKPAVQADLSKPVRPYLASDKFTIAERVEHPSFGQGVVEIAEPGKITVFFASGRRVLVQSKDGIVSGGLARPKPFDHANPPAGGKPVGET